MSHRREPQTHWKSLLLAMEPLGKLAWSNHFLRVNFERNTSRLCEITKIKSLWFAHWYFKINSFEMNGAKCELEGKEYKLKICDTAGTEDFSRLRILSYSNVIENSLSMNIQKYSKIFFVDWRLHFLLCCELEIVNWKHRKEMAQRNSQF